MKTVLSILALILLAGTTTAARAQTATNCTYYISTLPNTISVSGAIYCLKQTYYLTSVKSGSAITINADDVVLDLGGFTLDGVGSAATAVTITGQHAIVQNGTLNRWDTGINVSNTNTFDTRITNVRLFNMTQVGVYVASVPTVVDHCNFRNCHQGIQHEADSTSIAAYYNDNILTGPGNTPYNLAIFLHGGPAIMDHNQISDYYWGVECPVGVVGKMMNTLSYNVTALNANGYCTLVGSNN
jgi:hypothetical protein